MTFYKYLKSHAENRPDAVAIIEGDCRLSFSELCEQVESFASALAQLPLNANSKVGLLCLNQKEHIVSMLGCLLKGVPFIPFNFLLKPDDLVFIAQDAGIDILVVDSSFVKPEVLPFFNF